jgi:hypothetical protein
VAFKAVVNGRSFTDASGSGTYADLDPAAWLFTQQRNLLAFVVLITWGKLIKYVRLLPTLGPYASAMLRVCTNVKIFTFIVILLFFTAAVSLAVTIVFSAHVEGMSTIWGSVVSTLLAINGETTFQEDSNDVQSEFSTFIFFVVLLLGNLLLLNTFIAIVGEVYNECLLDSSQRWEKEVADIMEASLFRDGKLHNGTMLHLMVGAPIRLRQQRPINTSSIEEEGSSSAESPGFVLSNERNYETSQLIWAVRYGGSLKWRGLTTYPPTLRIRCVNGGPTHAILVEGTTGVLLWENVENLSSYELPFALAEETAITAQGSGQPVSVTSVYLPP